MSSLPVGASSGHHISRLFDPVFFGWVLVVTSTAFNVYTRSVVVLYLPGGAHTSGYALLLAVGVRQLLVPASSVTDFGAVCINWSGSGSLLCTAEVALYMYVNIIIYFIIKKINPKNYNFFKLSSSSLQLQNIHTWKCYLLNFVVLFILLSKTYTTTLVFQNTNIHFYDNFRFSQLISTVKRYFIKEKKCFKCVCVWSVTFFLCILIHIFYFIMTICYQVKFKSKKN